MPRVVVQDLIIDGEGRLIAATHGIGVWSIDAVVGVGDAPLSVMREAVRELFPNPIRAGRVQTFTLSVDALTPESLIVAVFDLQGKTVAALKSSRCNVGRNVVSCDLPALDPGLYFVQTRLGSVSATMKLVVLT